MYFARDDMKLIPIEMAKTMAYHQIRSSRAVKSLLSCTSEYKSRLSTTIRTPETATATLKSTTTQPMISPGGLLSIPVY